MMMELSRGSWQVGRMSTRAEGTVTGTAAMAILLKRYVRDAVGHGRTRRSVRLWRRMSFDSIVPICSLGVEAA